MVLYRQHRIRLATFLNLSADAIDEEMSARWNRLHKRTPESELENPLLENPR